VTERGETESGTDASRAGTTSHKLELLLSQPEIVSWLRLSKTELVAWLGSQEGSGGGDGTARAA
jgi:hypothetical protein